MASSQVRVITGNLVQGKLKGKAFQSALTNALTPAAIAKEVPKIQSLKKK